jgi:hypothetical protein
MGARGGYGHHERRLRDAAVHPSVSVSVPASVPATIHPSVPVSVPASGSVSVPVVAAVLLPVLALVLGACSGAEDPGQPTTGPALLENPLPDRRACRVARDRTAHAPLSWNREHALVTTSAGKTFLARLEGVLSANAISSSPARLVVSTMDPAGVLGPATMVPGVAEGEVFAVAAAPRGDGFALVWTTIAQRRMFTATFDAVGALTDGPQEIPLPEQAQRQVSPRLAAGRDGGFGVLYRSGSLNEPSKMFTFTLSASGGPLNPPREMGTGDEGDIAATATGYTAVWGDLDASGGPTVEIEGLDPEGDRAAAPRRIWQSARDISSSLLDNRGRGPTGPALLALEGGGAIVAWPELVEAPQSNLYDIKGGASIVWLQRLDAGGAPQGPRSPLRPPTPGVEEIEPSLLRFGDAVAVMWAHGSYSYLAGHGTPDHRIDLVLVDPTSLRPISNVASVLPPSGSRVGGLLRRSEAVLDRSILTTFNRTFHTYSEAESATFTCDSL